LYDECLLSWELASCERWVCAGAGRQLLSLAAALLSGCGTKPCVRDQLHLVSGCCTLQCTLLRWLYVWCEIHPWDYSVCTTQPCSSPPSLISLLLTLSHFHSYLSLHPPPFLLCSVLSFMLLLSAHSRHLFTPFYCPLMSLSELHCNQPAYLKINHQGNQSRAAGISKPPKYHRPVPGPDFWPCPFLPSRYDPSGCQIFGKGFCHDAYVWSVTVRDSGVEMLLFAVAPAGRCTQQMALGCTM